jgi:hypothetical protein
MRGVSHPALLPAPATSAGAGEPTRQAVTSLAKAGATLARHGYGMTKDKVAQIASLVAEPVAAPLVNLYHAIHGVLMAGNNACQALATETARQKGLPPEQIQKLARTLGAIDLTFQGAMMATAAGAAGVAPCTGS